MLARAGVGPVGGTDLRAVAVDADRTAWLADEAGGLYRIAFGQAPERVGTLGAVPSALAAAGAKLYARSDGRIDMLDRGTGAATLVAFVAGSGPLAATADALYATDGPAVVKVAGGVATTLAGSTAGDEDGAVGTARFADIRGLAIAGDALYVADAGLHRLRRVAVASGATTTLVGGGIGMGDGSYGSAAADVSFHAPAGLVASADGDRLLVADPGNRRVRTVNLSARTVGTAFALADPELLAGTGDGARFGALSTMALDSAGNVLAGDIAGDILWRVTPASVATRFAGNGQTIAKTTSLPRLAAPLELGELAFSALGTLFVAAARGFVVDSTELYPAAVPAAISVAADPTGRVFELVESGGSARLFERLSDSTASATDVAFPSGCRHLVAAPGDRFFAADEEQVYEVALATPATVRLVAAVSVRGMCFDVADGLLYVTHVDGGGMVEALDPATGLLTLVSGGATSGHADGAAAGATWSGAISGIAIDASRRLYVADGGRLRRVTRF